MKIRAQVVTAAAATAILFTASSGIFLSGSSRSFAEPLSADAIAALKAAVTNPSTSLSAVLTQMDAAQPGSSAQFVSALQNNTDTTTLATALQNLVAANGALQTTVTSALTTLAATPSLASLGTTGGNFLNLTNLASSGPNAGPIVSSTPPTAPLIASNTPSGNPSTPDAQPLPNPAAPGGGPGPLAGPLGSPFGGPQQGPQNGPRTPINPTSPPPALTSGPQQAPVAGNPSNPGQPASRA